MLCYVVIFILTVLCAVRNYMVCLFRKAFLDSQKQVQKALKIELDAMSKQQRKEVSKRRKEELEIQQKEEVTGFVLS